MWERLQRHTTHFSENLQKFNLNISRKIMLLITQTSLAAYCLQIHCTGITLLHSSRHNAQTSENRICKFSQFSYTLFPPT